MRSPAAAIAWEFRQRHRWGLIALAAYLAVLGTFKLVIVESGRRINLDTPESFAFAVAVPLATTFTYALAVFSFGLAGDFAGRQSMYPIRMFAMPMTTAALAGVPMLDGTITMGILWFAVRVLVPWPSGVDVPVIWPAVLAADLLAWTQALVWMPYGLRGMRVIVMVAWLTIFDIIVLLALRYNTPETAMVAFLAPQLPLAYLVARVAVTRARRGDVPDWRGAFAWLGRLAHVAPVRGNRFRTPEQAQTWFEWRQHGRSLPALVGILLPFELALLFLADRATPALLAYTLGGLLLTPPFMAAFVAATMRKSNPQASDGYGISPFVATRPLPNAALLAAKLEMTIWSTLAAWLLVLVAVPIGLSLSDTWPAVIEHARPFVKAFGAPRAIVIAALTLSGLIASTWKRLVQGLYIGLTGREWIVKTNLFLVFVVLFLLGPTTEWIIKDRHAQRALWSALPWIPAMLVCVKMPVAAWIIVRLWRSRLLSDRALVIGAAGWTAAVLALYGVFAWIVSSPFISHAFLACVAILAIPLARVSAAPLALAWDRHR